jgi:hypothetical protein
MTRYPAWCSPRLCCSRIATSSPAKPAGHVRTT